MKKLFILLFVVAAVSFSACGGAAKTEDKAETKTEEVVSSASKTVAQQYGELLQKSAELAKKVQSGDAAAAADIMKLQEEMTKFMEDNKDAIASFTAEEQAELVKIQEKIAADLVPGATK